MPGVSRVEAGRRRAKAAKRAVALTAAAGFAVVLALARQGHPATVVPTHSSSTGSVAQSKRGLPWQGANVSAVAGIGRMAATAAPRSGATNAALRARRDIDHTLAAGLGRPRRSIARGAPPAAGRAAQSLHQPRMTSPSPS